MEEIFDFYGVTIAGQRLLVIWGYFLVMAIYNFLSREQKQAWV